MSLKTKIIMYLVLGTLVLFGGGISYNFYSPTSDIFVVVSEDVKRATSDSNSHDQYRITAQRVSDGKIMTFRNEDAWFYFKWNSADVQGAAAISAKSNEQVVIKYYGWRFGWLSWFWNVISIKPTHA